MTHRWSLKDFIQIHTQSAVSHTHHTPDVKYVTTVLMIQCMEDMLHIMWTTMFTKHETYLPHNASWKMQLDVGNEPFLLKQGFTRWLGKSFWECYNTFWDMNFFQCDFWCSPDRLTDGKQCIWAHRAICTGGLKKGNVHGMALNRNLYLPVRNTQCGVLQYLGVLTLFHMNKITPYPAWSQSIVFNPGGGRSAKMWSSMLEKFIFFLFCRPPDSSKSARR